MKRSTLWIRTAIILAITLIGTYLVFGPRHAPTAEDLTWAGIKANLANNINLGLDLRGGSHLVMRVKTDDYLKTLTEENARAAQTAAEDAKLPVTGSSVVAANGNYAVTLELSDPAQAEAVAEEVKKKVDFFNWSQNVSGNTLTWSLPSNVQTVMKNEAVQQGLNIVETRINKLGVKEPTLQRHGADSSGQILLQMPGVDDPERVKKLIGAESSMQLMKVVSPPSPAPVQTYPTREAALQSLGGTLPPNRQIWPYAEKLSEGEEKPAGTEPTRWVVVENPAVVPGNEFEARLQSRGPEMTLIIRSSSI